MVFTNCETINLYLIQSNWMKFKVFLHWGFLLENLVLVFPICGITHSHFVRPNCSFHINICSAESFSDFVEIKILQISYILWWRRNGVQGWRRTVIFVCKQIIRSSSIWILAFIFTLIFILISTLLFIFIFTFIVIFIILLIFKFIQAHIGWKRGVTSGMPGQHGPPVTTPQRILLSFQYFLSHSNLPYLMPIFPISFQYSLSHSNPHYLISIFPISGRKGGVATGVFGQQGSRRTVRLQWCCHCQGMLSVSKSFDDEGDVGVSNVECENHSVY